MRITLLILVCIWLVACTAQPLTHEDSSTRGLTRNPEAAAINVRLGANYIASGDYRLADEKLRKAIKQDANSSAARWTYAILQERLEQPDAAEIYYKKALAVNSRDSVGQQYFASFLCRQGRYLEADKHFKKALSDPLFKARASTNLAGGVCAMEVPDYQSAKKYFSEVIRLQPKNRVALYQLGKLHFFKNELASAQSFLRDFEKVSEHTSESLWLAYRTERELGNFRIAQSYAKQLEEDFPTSQEARKLAKADQ